MRARRPQRPALSALLGACLVLIALPRDGAAAPPCPAVALPQLRLAPNPFQLDQLAIAVEGVESDYGRNAMMWRPDPAAAQGPMQVTLAAADDVGGGNRFDLAANRAIGRAYLGLLYRRYGDWPDAIAAYNWGPGNMDAWIVAGCNATALPQPVIRYLTRVLHADRTPRLADRAVADMPPTSRPVSGAPRRSTRPARPRLPASAPLRAAGSHREAFIADRTYARWQRQLIAAIAMEPIAGSQ